MAGTEAQQADRQPGGNNAGPQPGGNNAGLQPGGNNAGPLRKIFGEPRDEAAADAFCREWSDRLYAFAFRLLGNSSEAFDCRQQTLLKVIVNWEKFEGRARVETWIYRICYNDAISRMRKRPGVAAIRDIDRLSEEDLAALGAATAAIPANFERSEDVRKLHDCIQKLPVEHRRAILLWAGFSPEQQGEHSYAKIGEILNVSKSTVERHVKRALQDLQLCLEGHLSSAESETVK